MVYGKRLEIRLDQETRDDLSELAAERHVSMSEVVREAIRLMREQVDREKRRKAVEELCALEIEDVPEPEELSRQLASTYDVPASEHPGRVITDAEVLQELMHRYISIRRWDHGRRVLAAFARLMRGRIEPVYSHDVQRAAGLADDHQGIDARDLLHAAVMLRLGIARIASSDRAFDQIDDIERLDPMLVDEWAATITQAP